MVNIETVLYWRYEEVSYDCFYRDLFPEGSFEKKGVFEEGKYNGIAIRINGDKVRRVTVTDELEAIDEMVASDDFCLMSPISYVGKRRTAENARHLYALAIDLDGIESEKNLMVLFRQFEVPIEEPTKRKYGNLLPLPTYVVSSGTGLHLYYFFKKPISMFPNVCKELIKLKNRLTWNAWTQGASELSENIQYEPLTQGFRVVGSITKKGTRACAFKVGNKVDVEYLNEFVPTAYQADLSCFSYKSNLSLNKAKELYPEWYQSRVVEKKPRGHYLCNRALFDWWVTYHQDKVKVGHRYWCVLVMAIYAKKCGVSKKELEETALSLLSYYNSLNNSADDIFIADDVTNALEAYDERFITYPKSLIEQRVGFILPYNKRNGRKRSEHVKLMNFVRDEINQNANWRDGNGRPTKQSIVQKWQLLHPNGTKYQCQKDTNLDKKTIRKWWNVQN